MQGPSWSPAGPPGPAPMQPGAPVGMAVPGSNGPPTVLGVPLEPGERVLWFRQHSYKGTKITLIILGVLTLVILVGIFLLWSGLTIEKRSPKAHVLTNRRLIYFAPQGPPQIFPLPAITDVEPTRQQVNSGQGGLVGALAEVAATAAANKRANEVGKLSERYWERTIALTLTMHDGGKPKIPVALKYGRAFGFLLAKAVLGRAADALPATGFYAA